jgi:DNA-directed RNA polymerase
MLSRVARQKNAFFHVRRAHALRVLVPLPTTRLHSSSTSRNPLLNSLSQSLLDRPRKPSSQSERRLATAADHPSIDVHHTDSYDPFMHLPYENLDTSSLIILDSTPQSESKIFRRRHGVGGDETEMRANLDISLKIGQFDRAASLINRLGHYHPPGSQEFLSLHNRYMKEMVAYMVLTRDQGMVLPLQKWFEVDMPAGGVTPDAVTFAIMIRMALRMLHGSKRDRTVRRYWELAQNAEVEEELLGIEVLEDSDVGELSKVRLISCFGCLKLC